MQVTIKEKKNKNGSFRDRVKLLRENMQKNLIVDVSNTINEINVNIGNSGVDLRFVKQYGNNTRSRSYLPFRGADLENKKGKKVFLRKKVVSRSGDTKKNFTNIRFKERSNGLVTGSNDSKDFFYECSRGIGGYKAKIEIMGTSAVRLKKRINIINDGLRVYKKDWSSMKKAIRSEFKKRIAFMKYNEQMR